MGSNPLNFIANRLPNRQNILRVYAMSVLLTYSWTMLVSFWKLPSWLYFLSVGGIFSIYAYSFLVNFIESILLTFFVLFLAAIFPARWWKDGFVVKSITVFCILIASILLRLRIYRLEEFRIAFFESQFAWWICTVALAILSGWVLSHFKWLTNLIESFSDQVIVFLYIYLPLSAVSLIVIFHRNVKV